MSLTQDSSLGQHGMKEKSSKLEAGQCKGCNKSKCECSSNAKGMMSSEKMGSEKMGSENKQGSMGKMMLQHNANCTCGPCDCGDSCACGVSTKTGKQLQHKSSCTCNPCKCQDSCMCGVSLSGQQSTKMGKDMNHNANCTCDPCDCGDSCKCGASQADKSKTQSPYTTKQGTT